MEIRVFAYTIFVAKRGKKCLLHIFEVPCLTGGIFVVLLWKVSVNVLFTFWDTCSTLIPDQSFVLRATLCVPVVLNTSLEPKSKIMLFLGLLEVWVQRVCLFSYVFLRLYRSSSKFHGHARNKSEFLVRTWNTPLHVK